VVVIVIAAVAVAVLVHVLALRERARRRIGGNVLAGESDNPVMLSHERLDVYQCLSSSEGFST
jgi:hypothetical protein